MPRSATTSRGWYTPGQSPPTTDKLAFLEALQRLDQPFAVVRVADGPAVAVGGCATLGGPPVTGALPLLAWVPELTPDALGDRTFQEDYGVCVNYVAGAMANGIASAELVIEMARGGMLGFFGAAGLSTERIREAIDRIQGAVGDLPYGFNLIHSPQEPVQEQESVDLYLERGVQNVSASAYMRLTPMVVQFRVRGLSVRDGRVVPANHILAKVSREEVAVQFLRPPPSKILRGLVEAGRITADEAKLAAHIPVADDITAEADSGGHTDCQAAPVLLPLMCALRDRICAEQGYARSVRIGAAGGISTPASTAAAFALGAAYVVTGTVNQACVEAGTAPMVKEMLARAGVADVCLAPAPDMFEAGAQVQVLKRGTLYAMRGARLYELYRRYDSLDEIPADERAKLERDILRRPVGEVWAECESYFGVRDPAQLERAARDPRHQMALVFRWYLGRSSRWAIAGDVDRKMDVQVWCGPGIGAFNQWTEGTFLAEPGNRRVAVVAANLMAGAAAITRARWLSNQGLDPGVEAQTWVPRPVASQR